MSDSFIAAVRERPGWIWIPGGLAVVAGAICVAGAIAFQSPSSASSRSGPTALESAYVGCGSPGQLGTDALTLTMDTGAGPTVRDVLCVLHLLLAPGSVANDFQQTQAADGQQSGSWEGYSATWTVNDAKALHMVIREG